MADPESAGQATVPRVRGASGAIGGASTAEERAQENHRCVVEVVSRCRLQVLGAGKGCGCSRKSK